MCTKYIEFNKYVPTHGMQFLLLHETGIDCARIGMASQGLGIAQASLDCAMEYTGKRIAFGAPILKLQAVQVNILFCNN